MRNVEYTALSFRWGSANKEVEILLNGHPFSIRRNLWESLDEAQLSKHTGYLWIDAICIDQRDLQERNHQVALMRQIYSNADKVMVWLAKELAMNATPTISQGWLCEKAKYPGLCEKPVLRVFQEIDQQLCQAIPALLDGNNTDLQHLPRLGYMDGVLDGLERLFLVQYWERIWIAQEYILAQKIELRVGPDKLCRNALSRLCKVMIGYQYGSVDDPRLDAASSFSENFVRERTTPRIHKLKRKLAFDIIQRRDRWRDRLMVTIRTDPESNEHLECWSLEQLLRTFARSKCSEPMDHIYALLSLVHSRDLEIFNIKPDYTMTASELLVELAYGFCKLLGPQHCPKVIRPLAVVLGLSEKAEGYMLDMILDKVEKDTSVEARDRARDVMATIKQRYIYEVDDYIMQVGQEWKWLTISSRLNSMYANEPPSPASGTRTPAELDLEDSASLFASKALLSPTLDTVERLTAFL